MAVDLRRGPSYGQWVERTERREPPATWIPVASPISSPSALAEVQYKASGFWNRDCERSRTGMTLSWRSPGHWRGPASSSRCWLLRMRRHRHWLTWTLPASCSDANPAHRFQWTARPGSSRLLPATLANRPVELIATARRPQPELGVVGLDLADTNACRAAVVAYKPDCSERRRLHLRGSSRSSRS